MVGISASAEAGQRRDNEYAKGRRVWVGYTQGQRMISRIVPADVEYSPTYQQYPEVDEYFRHCFHERQRRLSRRAKLLPLVGTIFPNASYHGPQPRSICVWHPHGPTETEAWRFFLVDADAPATVKDVLRRYYMRYSGPASMTEQDDMENWLYAIAARKGTIAKRYPLNYQMSMKLPNDTDLGSGEVAAQMTDQTARNFYRAGKRYMNSDPGDFLLGRDL
jgi:hypothetical protein